MIDATWFKARKAELKVSDADIAQVIGKERSSVNRLLTTGAGFDVRYVAGLAAALNVTEQEILFRFGALKHAPDQTPIRKATDGDGSIPLIEVDLGFSMGDGSNLDDYIERGTIDFDANLLRTITHSPPHRLFVARGDGDSMMPTLIDNDQVVIDTLQRDLTLQDRIWACSIHGAGAIKRLRAIGKRRVLVISDNPTVDNQEVDLEDLRILGRVVWVGRRV